MLGAKPLFIVHDVVENRAGFPDLVQFWPDEPRYRMVDIKRPGDRLQDNQRRFLELCSQHEMPAFVCYVGWGEERTRLSAGTVRKAIDRARQHAT